MKDRIENWGSPVDTWPTARHVCEAVENYPATNQSAIWLPKKHERALEIAQTKPDQKNCSADLQKQELKNMVVIFSW